MMVDGKHYENITCTGCRQRHPVHLLCHEAAAIAKENQRKFHESLQPVCACGCFSGGCGRPEGCLCSKSECTNCI